MWRSPDPVPPAPRADDMAAPPGCYRCGKRTTALVKVPLPATWRQKDPHTQVYPDEGFLCKEDADKAYWMTGVPARLSR